MTPSKLQPALLGGAVMGVLSALPFIWIGNCCCLWIVGGGLTAAYVLQQNSPQPIAAGDGALVGFLAGIVGACVSVVLSIPISMAMGPMQARLLERVMGNLGGLPPEFSEMLENWDARSGQALQLILSFFFMLFLGMIFSTLGGLLGVALFKRSASPPNATGEAQPPQA